MIASQLLNMNTRLPCDFFILCNLNCKQCPIACHHSVLFTQSTVIKQRYERFYGGLGRRAAEPINIGLHRSFIPETHDEIRRMIQFMYTGMYHTKLLRRSEEPEKYPEHMRGNSTMEIHANMIIVGMNFEVEPLKAYAAAMLKANIPAVPIKAELSSSLAQTVGNLLINFYYRTPNAEYGSESTETVIERDNEVRSIVLRAFGIHWVKAMADIRMERGALFDGYEHPWGWEGALYRDAGHLFTLCPDLGRDIVKRLL